MSRVCRYLTCDQFHQDAANTPDVSFEAPAQPQDDFWRPVVPRADNGAVILILEGGAAKVNDLDLAGGWLTRRRLPAQDVSPDLCAAL